MAPYGSPWANIFLKLSQLKNVRVRFTLRRQMAPIETDIADPTSKAQFHFFVTLLKLLTLIQSMLRLRFTYPAAPWSLQARWFRRRDGSRFPVH